jgi:hypothetical protein
VLPDREVSLQLQDALGLDDSPQAEASLKLKTRHLLDWAKSGHLDFKDPPDEVRDVLQAMTRGLLFALYDYVAAQRRDGTEMITLSASMSRSFLLMDRQEPQPWDWMPEALREMDLSIDVVAQLPTDPGGQLKTTNFWAVDLPRLHLQCPPVPGRWNVHVRSELNRVTISGHLPEWHDLRLHPGEGWRVPPSLSKALDWYVSAGIGVSPEDVDDKARRLMEWVKPPHLDLKHPPQELQGLLEIVTPELLNAMREIAQVKYKSGIGIRQLTLTSAMSRTLCVPAPADGTAPPVLVNGLIRELNKMKGLTRLHLDPPSDATRVADLRGLELSNPEQATIVMHRSAGGSASAQDAYLPARVKAEGKQ